MCFGISERYLLKKNVILVLSEEIFKVPIKVTLSTRSLKQHSTIVYLFYKTAQVQDHGERVVCDPVLVKTRYGIRLYLCSLSTAGE